MFRKILIILAFFCLSHFSLALAAEESKISVIDAKMSNGVDEKLMPIKVTSVFPGGTSQVYCWFQWVNAEPNTKILARWRYETENMIILEYPFVIPRAKGTGSVLLSMPNGKILPSGLYRIDLLSGTRTLKSMIFLIEY